jgi:hypothetical protein
MNLTKKKRRKMGPGVNKEKQDHMVVCGTHILILIFWAGLSFISFPVGSTWTSLEEKLASTLRTQTSGSHVPPFERPSSHERASERELSPEGVASVHAD